MMGSALRRTAVIVAMTVGTVGCYAPRPPYRATTKHGIVWADSPSIATTVAAELDTLEPLVRRALGCARDVRTEVWYCPSFPDAPTMQTFFKTAPRALRSKRASRPPC